MGPGVKLVIFGRKSVLGIEPTLASAGAAFADAVRAAGNGKPNGRRQRGKWESLMLEQFDATHQPSKNNNGKDDNMNSTTDIPEIAHTFDPSNFTVVPARTFEDLRVGEIFRAPSRTLTDAHASAFQAVSADNHPIHYDVEYARRHGHTAPVVHGLQVLAFTAPGATLFPQYIGDVFIAFTEASCKFLKEVHAGDTLYSQLEIIRLTPHGDTGTVTTRATVHNQRGELVLDGEHTYSLKAASTGKK